MLPLVSGTKCRLLSINQTITHQFCPILTRPILWVALPPLVRSTHHSHYPLPVHSHSRLKTFLFSKSFPPSLSSSGLTPRIPWTVYWYFWAYPFLLFSFSVFHFLCFWCRAELNWLMSAFERTLKIVYRIVSYHTFNVTFFTGSFVYSRATIITDELLMNF